MAKNKSSGGAARLSRAEPKRTGPDRTGGRKPGAEATGPPPEPDTPPPEAAARDGEIHRIVADAVKLGYDVLGQNLHQGRAAADRIGARAYGPAEAQDDVKQLTGRLTQLVRDLATVSFDLMGAVMRDPNLHEALRPKPIGPAPGVPGGQVGVGCVVKGNSRAKAAPLMLTQPDAPARLTVAGLHSPQKSLKPITDVSFMASDDEQHVMVVITVPADQPAGVYSGVVCDAESHAPLGTLSVQVTA